LYKEQILANGEIMFELQFSTNYSFVSI